MAAEPRRARRGRCGYIRAPDTGCPTTASGQKDWGWRPGPGPNLHCPVQPAGGSLGFHATTFPRRATTCCVGRVTQIDGILFVFQIVKILTHYTPHGDLDERVTLNFIRTVQVSQICGSSNLCVWLCLGFEPAVFAGAGPPEGAALGSGAAAAHGCEADVSGHLSLHASSHPPRRPACHPGLPEDLLPAQSLTTHLFLQYLKCDFFFFEKVQKKLSCCNKISVHSVAAIFPLCISKWHYF